MPEIEEVFRLATQKVKPEPNALGRQILRQTTAERLGRARVYLLIASVLAAFAIVAVILASERSDERKAVAPSVSPTEAVPSGATPQTSEIVDLRGRVVSSMPGLPQDAFSFSMSADGSLVSFVTDPGGFGSLNQMGIISSDGSGLRLLTTKGLDVGGTAISPDGSKIAFEATGHESQDIYVIDTDGSGLRRLTRDPSVDQYPQWSPDGSTIVYDNAGSNPGDDPQFARTADIWSVSVNGGSPVRLTSTPGPDSTPSYSPDGSMIAYFHDGDVWVMRANGSHQRQLIRQGGRGGFTPRWSPDGSKVAFTVYSDRYRPQIAQSGSYRDAPLVTLVIYDLRTGARTDLPSVAMATDVNVPVWLPGSDRLLIRSVPAREPHP
jgi:Tol biopolymer transport system component